MSFEVVATRKAILFNSLCIVVLMSTLGLVMASAPIICKFEPGNITIPLGGTIKINITFFVAYDEIVPNGSTIVALRNITSPDLILNPVIRNRRVAKVLKASIGSSHLSIKSIFLGKTILTLGVKEKEGGVETNFKCEPIQITVIRKENALIIAFRGLVLGFIVLNTFLFGCKIDSEAIAQLIKKPFAIILGAMCQLIGMPLIAYGYSQVLGLNPTNRIGLFLVGCSPGGGSSNLWTYMLGGDLLLSICMTFVNTLGTFASMPAWFALLGHRIFPPLSGHLGAQRTAVKIPYVRIMTSLLYGTLPPVLGMLLRKYKPTVAQRLARWVKPFTICMIVVVIVIGIVANLYIFKVLETRNLLLAGMALPWTGFVLGYVACLVFNLSLRLLAPFFPSLIGRPEGRRPSPHLSLALCSTGQRTGPKGEKGARSDFRDSTSTLDDGRTYPDRGNGSTIRGDVKDNNAFGSKSFNCKRVSPPPIRPHQSGQGPAAERGDGYDHGGDEILPADGSGIRSIPLSDHKVTWDESRADGYISGPARITVAIETGLQNAGIAMVLLWSVYPQPEADLAIAIPVACSMMTPIPLLTLYALNQLWRFLKTRTFFKNL